ncbi:hypothetical protein Ddye_024788 [Dipteronia dyeriana]|uniref:MADS-box domain-containing protein n=1 Tax=Dipteronia dyeriana TaxID=168575 RepID=A0AAD9TVH8_9ROSI|nr:hypothetical protein Ddye_024788 [Dipteronia dyeriana]
MGTGKKKIEIKKIEKDRARMVTFSKRRQGLFKKAGEYATKTGSQVAILVFSPAGKPYVYGSPCFDTLLEKFIQGDKIDDTMNGDGAGVGEGRGGDEAGVGRDVEEMFSRLEERMGNCESVEELMEVRGMMEKMRDKVLKRLNDVREDVNIVQNDVNVNNMHEDVTVDSGDDFVASLFEGVSYMKNDVNANYYIQEDKPVTVSLYSRDSEDDFVASLFEDVNYYVYE